MTVPTLALLPALIWSVTYTVFANTASGCVELTVSCNSLRDASICKTNTFVALWRTAHLARVAQPGASRVSTVITSYQPSRCRPAMPISKFPATKRGD